MMANQRYSHFKSLEPVAITLQKGLCRGDQVKDLKMGTLSWVIGVGLWIVTRILKNRSFLVLSQREM